MKIIQYSQHVLGIGHFMRSLEICQALSDHDLILVTGGPPVDASMPGHAREFRLPDLQMNQEFKGLFSSAKNLTVDQVKQERRQRLLTLFEKEKPDLFLVELYPFGRKAFRFEIDPILQAVYEKKLPPCRVVCSVRDILVEKEDQSKHEARAVKTLNAYFDAVLVHADPQVVKLEETFTRCDEISIPVSYTGYIASKPAPDSGKRIREQLNIGRDELLIVASAGGGHVGGPLLEAVIKAFRRLQTQGRRHLKIFTGPYVESSEFEALQRKAGGNAQVQKFTTEFLSYLAAANLSVSMGGYNTTMNILASRVPALLWPFSQNREQRLRAQRLAHFGLLTVLEDADLQPDRLAAMMDEKLSQAIRPALMIDLDGAAATAARVHEWISKKREEY
jgi:predicted glycosyltransferase